MKDGGLALPTMQLFRGYRQKSQASVKSRVSQYTYQAHATVLQLPQAGAHQCAPDTLSLQGRSNSQWPEQCSVGSFSGHATLRKDHVPNNSGVNHP
jgi:hypothetical protein